MLGGIGLNIIISKQNLYSFSYVQFLKFYIPSSKFNFETGCQTLHSTKLKQFRLCIIFYLQNVNYPLRMLRDYMNIGRLENSLNYFIQSIANLSKLTMEQAQQILITNEQLHSHNTPKDAWVSYCGFVYNVTPYIKFHPGGLGCFQAYFGFDIAKIIFSVHGTVNVAMFLRPVVVGRLDGEPEEPRSVGLRVEGGKQ